MCALFCFSSFYAEKGLPKTYTIDQFMNTKSYASEAFSFDEKKIFFSSDESGIFNVYSFDLTNGKQTQLTFSTQQAIMVISGFPNDRFIYTCDGLGNELYHLYLWESPTSSKDLTPYPRAKCQFLNWSRDFNSFFFLSNHRDPHFMDLYEMDVQTLTPQCLFQNKEYEIGGISPSKLCITLHKQVNANNIELFLYHLPTGEIEAVDPHPGEDILNMAVGFSPDDQALYFLTNRDHEFNYLTRYDRKLGQIQCVEKYDWDITNCRFSRNGKYRSTTINQDGKMRTVVHDVSQSTSLVIPLPKDQEITHLQFSKSEVSLLLGVGESCKPQNLFYYPLKGGSLLPLTHALGPDIRSQDLVEGQVVRFPSYDGAIIPAIFYEPHGIKKGEKIPALIYVHGGPGGQCLLNYQYLLQFLVNHGYAVLAINHRGSSGYGKTFFKAADGRHGEADLDDCIWAKKFLAATYPIPVDQIGIMGGSYGGYMTLAALAFRPQEMAVGVDIFGVSNWVRTLKNTPSWWACARESLYKKIGNPETEAEYLESISPYFHADKIVKPLLVLQGKNDPRVLQIESDQIIEAVKKNGIPYRYVLFEDDGHGFTSRENRRVAALAILQFLEEHLKKPNRGKTGLKRVSTKHPDHTL